MQTIRFRSYQRGVCRHRISWCVLKFLAAAPRGFAELALFENKQCKEHGHRFARLLPQALGKGKQQCQPKKIRVFVEFERRSRGQLEALFLSDYRACLCQWRVTGTRPAAVPRTSVSFVSSWWVALLLCHGDFVLWSRWLVRVGPPAAQVPDRRPPTPVTAEQSGAAAAQALPPGRVFQSSSPAPTPAATVTDWPCRAAVPITRPENRCRRPSRWP